MFPQTRWPSGLLVATALITLCVTAQADDSICALGDKRPECVLCQDITTQDCCSDPQLNKCKFCTNTECSSQNAGRFKRENGEDLGLWKNEELDEDKRAKYFLGKRAKYFLGKREDDGYDGLVDNEMDEDKRAKYFLGKRAKYFLGKRAKYFLGKRDYADDEDQQMGLSRRAKYFLGKRAKYFLGKRDDEGDDYDWRKRAKYFLGKREYYNDAYPAEDKRQKYFLGKRSTDNAEASQ